MDLSRDPVVRAAQLGIAPPAPDTGGLDAVVQRVLERLRRTSIATRAPGWLDPTFRSASIRFRFRHTADTPGIGEVITVPVAWEPQKHGGAVGVADSHVQSSAFIQAGEPQPFPSGYVGAVRVSVQAAQAGDPQAMRPMTELRFNVVLNGGILPGHVHQFVAGADISPVEQTFTVPTTAIDRSSLWSPAPILLRANDRMQVQLVDTTAAATTVTWDVVVQGWYFPEELSGQTAGSYWSD